MTHSEQHRVAPSALPPVSPTVAETAALLNIVICALVSHKSAVEVTMFPGPQTLFRVRVEPKEMGKLIGKQGRIARSLRILLNAIAKENGQNYALDLDSAGFVLDDSDAL